MISRPPPRFTSRISPDRVTESVEVAPVATVIGTSGTTAKNPSVRSMTAVREAGCVIDSNGKPATTTLPRPAVPARWIAAAPPVPPE